MGCQKVKCRGCAVKAKSCVMNGGLCPSCYMKKKIEEKKKKLE